MEGGIDSEREGDLFGGKLETEVERSKVNKSRRIPKQVAATKR